MSLAAAGREASLIEAAKTGELQTVRALAKQRVDLNATEADGTTALHWAVHRDHAEIADALIRAGAECQGRRTATASRRCRWRAPTATRRSSSGC